MVQLSLGKNVFSIPVVAELNRGRVEIHGAIQRRQLQYLLIIENTTKQHLPQEDNRLLHHDALVKYLNVGNDVDSRPGFSLNPTHLQRLPPRHYVLISQLLVITCQSDCHLMLQLKYSSYQKYHHSSLTHHSLEHAASSSTFEIRRKQQFLNIYS